MSARPAEPPRPDRPVPSTNGPVPPVVPAAAAFAAGVATAGRVDGVVTVLLAVLGLGLAAWRVRIRGGGIGRGVLPLLVAAFAAGLATGGGRSRPIERADAISQESRLVRFDAVVAERPRTLRRERPFVQEPELRGLLTVRPVEAAETVRLLADGPFTDLAPGDAVTVTGWLLPSRPRRNPGERVWPDAVPAVAVGEAVNVVRVRRGSAWSRLRSGVGDAVSDEFHARLAPDDAALADALLLGRRDGLTRDFRDRLAAVGVVHLISISGLHLGLLAWFVRRLARAVGCGPDVATWLPAITVAAYALLIDPRPPAVRAAIAVGLWAVVETCGRRATAAATLAAAAVLILAATPDAIGDLGAQLSFLAILGVTLPFRAGFGVEDDGTYGDSHPWWERAVRSGVQIFLAGCGATAFTAPVAAAEIGLVAPLSPLAGMVLLPPIAAMLFVGFGWLVAVPTGLTAWTPLGGLFATAFAGSARLFDSLFFALGLGSGTTVVVPEAATVWTIATVAGLVAVYAYAPRLGRLRTAAAVVVALAVAAVPHLIVRPPDGLRVTFLDVGHGGATLIETPDGRAALFDCGSLGDGRRAARAVGDALRARGLAGLDAVFLSHADADHDNGLTILLRRHRVASVVTTRAFLGSGEPISVATRDAIASGGIPLTFAAAGDRIDLGGGVAARVLAPSLGSARGDGSDNETSLVLAVEYAGRTIMLTGDIEGAALVGLLDRTPALRASVVAAPHHGSDDPSLGRLVATWRPDRIVVAAGRRRSREAVETVYAGAEVLWTGDGALTVDVGRDGAVGIARGP